MDILLIRHGKKIANDDRHADDLTLGLSAAGKEEMRKTAKQLTQYLRENYPNLSPKDVAIYYSPLERTTQSLKILQQHSHPSLHNCQSTSVDFLKEKHKGLGYTHTKAQLRKMHPTFMEQLYDSHSDALTGRMTRKLPGAGAESVMDLISKHDANIRGAIAASEKAGKKLVIMIGHSCSSRAVAGALCFDGELQNMSQDFLQDTWNLTPSSVMHVQGDIQHGYHYDGLIDLVHETQHRMPISNPDTKSLVATTR